MKRALTLVFVLALPLAAEEPKTASTPKEPAEKTKTATAEPVKKTTEPAKKPATAAAAAEPAAAQPDSPLVALAKRANRKNKKPGTIVITNESLKTSGANAHVTTTTNQYEIKMPQPMEPPRPTPEMADAQAKEAQRKAAAEQADKDRQTKEEKDRKAAQRAAANEEGYVDGVQDDAEEFVGTAPPPPQF